MDTLYITIGLWLGTAVCCYIVAEIMELDGRLWFFRGLAFGVFALIKLLRSF